MSNDTFVFSDGAKLRLPKERTRRKKGNDAINHPELERHAGDAALGEGQAQKGDTASHLVRITCRRVRPIDEDNLAEKFAVDALRYAGAIPNDNPAQTHIECRQEKIGKEEREETRVEIFSLP